LLITFNLMACNYSSKPDSVPFHRNYFHLICIYSCLLFLLVWNQQVKIVHWIAPLSQTWGNPSKSMCLYYKLGELLL
jgi:hypothetical protein